MAVGVHALVAINIWGETAPALKHLCFKQRRLTQYGRRKQRHKEVKYLAQRRWQPIPPGSRYPLGCPLERAVYQIHSHMAPLYFYFNGQMPLLFPTLPQHCAGFANLQCHALKRALIARSFQLDN